MPRGDLAAWEQRRVADSSPRRFSLHPPYSPIAATSLQNCTNILDYPASWQCLVPSVAVGLPFPIRTRRGNPLLGREITTTWRVDIKCEKEIMAERAWDKLAISFEESTHWSLTLLRSIFRNAFLRLNSSLNFSLWAYECNLSYLNIRTISLTKMYIKNSLLISLLHILFLSEILMQRSFFFTISDIPPSSILLDSHRAKSLFVLRAIITRAPPKSSETVLLLESRDMLRIATTPFSSP